MFDLSGMTALVTGAAGGIGSSIARALAGQGARLEYVTPERIVGPEVGGTSYPAYLKAMSLGGVSVTLNLRLERIARRGNQLAATFHDEYANRRVERIADLLLVEHGTLPNDALYFDLKPGSRKARARTARSLPRRSAKTSRLCIG